MNKIFFLINIYFWYKKYWYKIQKNIFKIINIFNKNLNLNLNVYKPHINYIMSDI